MTTPPTASPELPDLDHLEALARAATPGKWKAMPFGRVVGGPPRHYINGSAPAQIASFNVTYHEQAPEDEPERQQANADFAAAANPEQVLALIALARRTQPEGEAPLRRCSKFGHRCNCAVDCDPAKPHPSMDATLSPLCGAQHADSGKEVRPHKIAELLRIYDEQGGDWCKIARAVEGRYVDAPSAPGTPEAPKGGVA